jgi:hypothetical protein
MKKSMNKWLLVLLALSLLIPVYSMADMKLNLMTDGGVPITTEDAVIKNFFVSSDGTNTYLNAVLGGAIKFGATDPDIGIEELNGSPLDNIVTVEQNGSHPFKVVSDTPEVTFSMPVNPPGTWASPQFSPNTTFIGNYLAVFQADITTPSPKSSQIVVLIKVVSPGYTLTINQSANGTISAPKTTGFSLTSPESVLVTATPATGYRLASWGGALSGTTNPATLVMNGNKTVTATFELIPSPFTLTINQSANGTISAPKTTGFPGYSPYESVLVTATPATGYRLASWGGALSGTTSPASLVMDSNKTVSATFELIPANTYLLTVVAGTGGTVTSTPASGGSYAAGTSVTIQAYPTPGTNYTFSNWDSSNVYPTGNPATFTTPSSGAPVTVTAIFTSGSSGTPGTEGNPIPLIQPLPALNGYGYEKHYTNGEYMVLRGGTSWFKIDPSLISGLATPSRFKLNAINYDAYQVNVSCKIYLVDRASPTTKTLLTTLGVGQAGYYVWTYSPSKYYLISMTEDGTENQYVTLYWTLF